MRAIQRLAFPSLLTHNLRILDQDGLADHLGAAAASEYLAIPRPHHSARHRRWEHASGLDNIDLLDSAVEEEGNVRGDERVRSLCGQATALTILPPLSLFLDLRHEL